MTGCLNNNEREADNYKSSSDRAEDKVEVPTDSKPKDPAVINWITYNNERFQYALDYPEDWGIQSAENNDGVTFRTGDARQDLRVYASNMIEGANNPLTQGEKPSLTQEDIELESGIEGTVVTGELDKHHYYEIIVTYNDIAYHFVTKTTDDYYEENQKLLHYMGQSLTIRKEDNKQTFTKDKAMSIETAFFDQLYTPETVGKTNEMKDYQSKAALIEATSAIASRDLVKQHVDDYYREEDGSLYVVPKDGPAKLLSDSSVSINQVDEETFHVSQQNENALRGAYILTVEFSWMDDAWKMTDRIFEVDN